MATTDDRERAPEAPCGAVTTFGGAFAPMACTLPAGHTGPHDADSAVPVPEARPRSEAREALRERVAWEVAAMAGVRLDDPPLPEHYDAADRILALLATAPAPEGEGKREGLRERIAALKESGNGYCVDPHWDRYYDGWNAAIDAVLDELLAPGHTDLMVSPEAIDAALTQDMSARQNHEAPTIHPDWMEVGMELCINPDGEVVLFEGGAHFTDGAWEPVDDGDGLRSMTLGQVQPVSVELARTLRFRQEPEHPS